MRDRGCVSAEVWRNKGGLAKKQSSFLDILFRAELCAIVVVSSQFPSE